MVCRTHHTPILQLDCILLLPKLLSSFFFRNKMALILGKLSEKNVIKSQRTEEKQEGQREKRTPHFSCC